MTRPTTWTALLALVGVTWAASTYSKGLPRCGPNDGRPFGESTAADQAALASAAKRHGLDLERAVRNAAAGDQSALEATFQLARQFRTLDGAARAYGNLLYSMLLNIGETRGLDDFTTVLLRQDAALVQRLRDFLYYPAVCPESPADRAVAEKSARDQFPRLWPKEYVFGERDSLFK